MLTMSNSVKVKLLSIRNPDEIYIKFLEGEKSRNNAIATRKINGIQDKLAILSEKAVKIENPKLGEVYGCYIEAWKKWIRGRVMWEQNNNGYTIFCIDQGHYKSNISQFLEISDELKSENMLTCYKVSLGLKPLKMNKWDVNVFKMCKEIDHKNNTLDVRFVSLYEEANVSIGDLFLFDGDDHYSLTEKLIDLKYAMKPTTDFNQIFNMLHDKEIGPIKCVQPKKRLEMYDSQTKEIEEAKLPKNLIIHGNDLKPFWNSIDHSGFQSFLKNKFSFKNKPLNDIQKVIWPQISVGKHSFVISSNQECLTSVYLLPLINYLVSQQKRQYSDKFGPITIIFANNSSRVEEIAKQCENYAKQNISVVKAVGLCEKKKVDLMNGCDILITTPSAFIRLVQNVSVKIIDENRLKHIVFDSFDQNSLTQFGKELSFIMSSRYNKDVAKMPQTIVVSKTFSKSLQTKILNYLPTLDTVKCMDNYLDAAAFVGLSISIEVSLNQTDKLDILFKNNFDDYQKNIIVVSDSETLSQLEKEFSMRQLKAIKCDDPKIAKVWSELSPNNILIINNAILNDSIIQNGNNLIHYDLPSNLCFAITTSDQFSKRFKVFQNEILKKLNSQEEAAALKTKIILSNENVSQFEELINLLIGRNLLKANEKVVEKIYEKKEAAKGINRVYLCQNVLQFGECKKFNCVNRHKLSEQDKPPINLEIFKKFITFDVVFQQGPTTFVIKIREYFDNKWISCVQSNEYIQQKLDVDMQRYCNEKSNALALSEGKVGEIYAKYDTKLGKWVRGKMIKRESLPIVKLNLLDYIPPDMPTSLQSLVIPVNEKTLLKLPEEYTKINPLLVNLQIMNLVPLDGENSYGRHDVDKFNDLIGRVPKSVKFSAKIETIIGDVMFAKDIEAKNDKKTVIFRLTDAHSNLGISETDEGVAEKILRLSSTLQDIGKEDSVSNIKEPQIMTKETNQNQNVISGNSNKSVEALKFWKQLKCDVKYSIAVKDYISPYSFFAVLINQENLTLKKCLATIEESQDQKQLVSININECCLLKSNNRYLRAVVLKIIADDQIEVLLVDHGEIQKCGKEKLFELPQEFLNLNFQAVHCSMLGIRPKFNMAFWPKMQRSAVHSLISKYNEKSLKMFVVSNDQKKHQFSEIGVSSYDVLLYDGQSKIYLNKLAVKEGIADGCAEYNYDYYESTDDEDYDSLIETSSSCSGTSKEIKDTDEFDVSEEMQELIKKFHDSVVDKVSGYVSGTDTADSTRMLSIDVTNTASSDSESIVTTPSLKSIFKLPHIEWRQNESMLYLLISASDCKEYALSINETSLDVTIKYQDDKIERTIIQLYGSIMPKFCSHELAGIKIIVRLAKKLCAKNWPRLTMSQEKSIYIKFSSEIVPYEYVDIDENQKYACKPFLSDSEENNEDDDLDSNASSDDEYLLVP